MVRSCVVHVSSTPGTESNAWRTERVPPSSLMSGACSFDPAPFPPQVPVLRPDLLQSWDRGQFASADIPIKNTFISFPNWTPPPTGAARVVRSCPPGAMDKENEAGNLPQAPQQPFTPLKAEAEESAGSGSHPHDCKPCAWFHHARGCQRGENCEFCHLCPPGEIKRRKKDKYRLLRERRGAA